MNRNGRRGETTMTKQRSGLIAAAIVLCGLMSMGADGDGCNGSPPAKSASGISKVTVQVPKGADGMTTEQRNIAERLKKDNEPGAIKHLYVISAYSGQVLIYSTVKGKVTSGGKRLTPTSVNGGYGSNGWYGGFAVNIGGTEMYTNEVLQDDGTYGSSGDYLYWWDTKGVYHQHYVQGGQIVHVSSEPIAVKSVVINMEITPAPGSVPAAEDPLPHPTPGGGANGNKK
jgi:hypothetical protein